MQLVQNIIRHKGGGIFSVAPDATVYEAIAAMAEKEVGALLVMDGGQPVGIISERDYTRKVILKDRSSKAAPRLGDHDDRHYFGHFRDAHR